MLSSFTSSVGSSIMTVGKWAAAITGVAAGALSVLVGAQLQSIDAITKTSAALGVSTEAWSAYLLAADLAGVSSEQLTTAFRTMQKRIGEAGDGLSTAVRSFEKLGLSAESFIGLDAEEAFRLIIDRLSGVEDQFTRAQVAQELFGRGGLGMLEIATDGAAGLDRIRELADRMGLTFSRVEGTQVAAFNDSLTLLKLVLAGVGRQIAINVVPYLAVMTNRMMEIATSSGPIGDRVSKLFEGISLGAAKVLGWVDLLKAGWFALQGTVIAVAGGVIASVNEIGKSVVWLANLLPGVEMKFSEFGDAMVKSLEKDAAAAFAKAGEALDSFVSDEREQRIRDFFETAREESRRAAEELLASREAQQAAFADETPTLDMIESLDATESAMEKMRREAEMLADSLRTPMERFRDELERIQELYTQGFIDEETYRRAIAQARDMAESALAEPIDIGAGIEGQLAAAQESRFGIGRGDAQFVRAQNAQERLLRDQLSETKRLNRTQERMLREIEEQEIGGV